MRIITLITKRSVREPNPERQKKLFFTSLDYSIGDIIEIIDGNKKSSAYVSNLEDASIYKQAIRSGELELPKLKLSKTGDNKDGVVIAHYDDKIFDSYLGDFKSAHATKDKFLHDFFPKKRPKKVVVKKKRAKADSFTSLSVDRYFGNKNEHPTEMHELVDVIRKYFGEDARYGQGSFSYYLGFFKKIPNQVIRQYFAESKNLPKGRDAQRKTFWWKIGNHVKKKD